MEISTFLNNSFEDTQSIFFLDFLAHEIAGINDVAVNVLLFNQFLELLIVISQRICSEWVGIRNNNQFVQVNARRKSLCRRTFCCQCGTHNGSKGSSFQFNNRWNCRVFHNPEDRINRGVNLVHTVRRPELGLDGTAIAVTDIFCDKLDLAVLIHCSGAVLSCQKEFVVSAACRIVRSLVEICRFNGNG